MPETAVYKDSNFRSNEGYICPTARAWQHEVDPITKAKRSEGRANSQLTRGVPLSGSSHAAAHFRRRRCGPKLAFSM